MGSDPATLGVNLGTRLARIMARSRTESTAALIPHIRVAIEQAVTVSLVRVARGGNVPIKEELEEFFGTSPLPDRTTGLIDLLERIHPLLAVPLLAIGVFLSLVRLLQASGQPFVVETQAEAFAARPTVRLDAATAAQAEARNRLTAEEAEQEAREGGVDRERYRALVGLATQLPTPEELFSLVNRGTITEAAARDILNFQGFLDDDIEAMLTLRDALPGPQDVVRFAVRDVYRPEAVSRGGLLQDLPDAGKADAERVGLRPEEFEKFWAAHWVLPAVNQAFEMWHRSEISEEEVRGLLRTLDIAPGWRDELLAIAFRVITRVDIRRMYREGVADEAKVLETYLSQGYTADDAELLTEFAIADATTDARELTKSEILNLYQDGALQRSEALDLLKELGFRVEESEWVLNLADVRRVRRFQELAVSRVRSRYAGRRLSDTEASTALDRLGVVTEERDALIDIWDAERDANRPQLSPALIGRLYNNLWITEDDARVRWGQQGFRSDDIDLLVVNYADNSLPEVEEGPKVRQLTKSDIGRALRDDTIDIAEAVARWMRLDYSEADALILARNYLPEEET